MNVIISDFSELTAIQVQDLYKLRQNVFILEQNCFYEDIDGEDPNAKHILFYKNTTLAAYMRIFPPAKKYTEASMGRIVVHPDYRGTGTAISLIQHGIDFCGNHPIRIEAQVGLTSYYSNFGFIEDGESYSLDGIDHIQMLRKGKR